MTSKFWKSSRTVAIVAIMTLFGLSPLGCTAVKPSAQASPMSQKTMTKQGAAGAFVSVEHQTTGNVAIVTEGSKRYLTLNRNFQTSAGPDLFVILHRASKPQSYSKDSYILLGKLQNIKGEQRYAIPSNLDLKSYKSAVIWCRQFSATFAYAPLP
jgi:Electron transfer DM13